MLVEVAGRAAGERSPVSAGACLATSSRLLVPRLAPPASSFAALPGPHHPLSPRSCLCSFLVGIMALDSHPLKPGKRDMGQRDVPVVVGGVTIQPGDYLYADEDGIIVTSKEIAVPDDAPKEKQALTIPE